MIRLNMIVEGQTEETFVRDVLREPLAEHNVFVSVRCVEMSRSKGKIHRGGFRRREGYKQAKRDIERWMKEDQNTDAYFTTMFDLYALPDDFPGYDKARSLPPYERVSKLEESFKEDINHPRFLPYLQLHEFEALLLCDPSKLDWEFMEHEEPIRRLAEECAAFESPELINDGEDTAPSKRIIREIPEYKGRKTSAGPLVASKIGLEVLREKCRHFREWLCILKLLPEIESKKDTQEKIEP